MGFGEHLGVLLTDPDQVVDVEEPAMAAGLRIDVEVFGAQRLVGPVAVGLVGGHVVGHDVEHDPQARGVRGGHQLPERRLAAEVGRQPGRVDDVVTVGGAGAGLQRR